MATQKPHTKRLGRVAVSIFEHVGDNGKWYSTSFSRSYLDEQGKPKYTDRFNPEDLPVVMKLADYAARYILAAQN